MPVDLFDTALPVAIAIAVFLLFAARMMKGTNGRAVITVMAGLVMVFAGFDYIVTTSDPQVSLLLVFAGVAVILFGFWER